MVCVENLVPRPYVESRRAALFRDRRRKYPWAGEPCPIVWGQM